MKHIFKHFLTHKKQKKKDFFSSLFSESKTITRDLSLLYRNFLFWNISKVSIVLWSFVLGLILAFPVFFIMAILAFLDPIRWAEILAFLVGGTDPTLELISLLSSHPYWLMSMFFCTIVFAFLFLLGNSYHQVLYARLHLSLLKGEQLPYIQPLFFSRPHIKRFVGLGVLNICILFIPALVGIFFFFLLYLLHSGGYISFGVFSGGLFILTLMTIFVFSYIIYRILFGIVILASSTQKDFEKHNSYYYIKKSILLTTGYKNYLKFIFVLGFIFILLSPLRWFEENLQNDRENLQTVIEYRALKKADSEAASNYEKRVLAESFSDMSDMEVVANFKAAGYLGIIWFFVSFFLLSGLYSMAFVSFYTRVLSHSKK